jgi:hypothetical protein
MCGDEVRDERGWCVRCGEFIVEPIGDVNREEADCGC